MTLIASKQTPVSELFLKLQTGRRAAHVHEVYERLVGNTQIEWQSTNHFFAFKGGSVEMIGQ